jgi:hypothetical protein
MEQGTSKTECLSIRPRDILTDLLRQGAQERLATALENEVAEYIERHAALRDDEGHRRVVRNGREPDNNRQCILVLMGATVEGRKELIAITDGYRESADSWRELLLDVKQRGLTTSPKLATGDGALGFWAAPCAEKHWRRLNGQELIPEVIRGVKFVDGIKEIAA